MVAIYGDVRPYDPDQLTAGTSLPTGPPSSGEPPPPPAGDGAKQETSGGIFSKIQSIFNSGIVMSVRKVLNLALFALIVAILGYYSLGYG